MENLDKVVLVLAQNVSKELVERCAKDAYVVGIDAGAKLLLDYGVPFQEAIGDFDSISPKTYESLRLSGVPIVNLPIEKDDTDTAFALKKFAKAKSIVILGGIQGKRPEHFLANAFLLLDHPNAFLVDDDSCLRLFLSGDHGLRKEGYRYFSLFPLGESKIKATGLRYSFPNAPLPAFSQLGVSNEFIGEAASFTLEGGPVLVLLSKGD